MTMCFSVFVWYLDKTDQVLKGQVEKNENQTNLFVHI